MARCLGGVRRYDDLEDEAEDPDDRHPLQQDHRAALRDVHVRVVNQAVDTLAASALELVRGAHALVGVRTDVAGCMFGGWRLMDPRAPSVFEYWVDAEEGGADARPHVDALLTGVLLGRPAQQPDEAEADAEEAHAQHCDGEALDACRVTNDGIGELLMGRGAMTTDSRWHLRSRARPPECGGLPQAFTCSQTRPHCPAMAPPRRHFDRAAVLAEAGTHESMKFSPSGGFVSGTCATK